MMAIDFRTTGATGAGATDMGFHVMAKPSGPACNLDCDYCFYLEEGHPVRTAQAPAHVGRGTGCLDRGSPVSDEAAASRPNSQPLGQAHLQLN